MDMKASLKNLMSGMYNKNNKSYLELYFRITDFCYRIIVIENNLYGPFLHLSTIHAQSCTIYQDFLGLYNNKDYLELPK